MTKLLKLMSPPHRNASADVSLVNVSICLLAKLLASTSMISATTDSTATDEITLDVRIEENVRAPTEGMKLTNINVFSSYLLFGRVDD